MLRHAEPYPDSNSKFRGSFHICVGIGFVQPPCTPPFSLHITRQALDERAGMSSEALPWLSSARRAAVSLQASSRGKRGVGHSVYVALLHDPRLGERWGLYVGQTSLDPDLRFDQHKSGYKASSAVKRFGVRLMPDLVEHLNPMAAWEAIDLEAALANAFRAAGVPWVEGGH
jgi:hypothetical protein